MKPTDKLPCYQILGGLLGYWSELTNNNIQLDFEKLDNILLKFSRTFPNQYQFAFRYRGGNLICLDLNIVLRNLVDSGWLIQELPSSIYHLTPQGIKMYEEKIKPALQEAECWEFIQSTKP